MNRYVILALLAAALLVGLVASGCNRKRDRDPSLAQAKSKNSKRNASRKINASGSRPAEVLAASTHRANNRSRQTVNRFAEFGPIPPITQSASHYAASPAPAPVQTTYAMAAPSLPTVALAQAAPGYEPLPEPIPLSQLPGVQMSAATPYNYNFANAYAAPAAPAAYAPPGEYGPAPYQTAAYSSASQPNLALPTAVYQTQTALYEPAAYQPASGFAASSGYATGDYLQPNGIYDPPVPIQVIHPTPDLALARAVLATAPNTDVYIAPPPLPEVYVPSTYSQPYQAPQNFCPPAPIPELEPVRYQRAAINIPDVPELTPIMMSGRDLPLTNPSGQQSQGWLPNSGAAYPANYPVTYPTTISGQGQANPFTLLPLPALETEASQDWTPSPATAMRKVVYY